MEPLEAENTDVTSIKPVSSLRSQFETLATKKPTTPNSPSTLAPPGKPLIVSTGVEGERPRASLDIPRPLWGGAPESHGLKDAVSSKLLERPQRRDLNPATASRQRPISMGPWSQAEPLPEVILQPPTSPPRAEPCHLHFPGDNRAITTTPESLGPRPGPSKSPVPARFSREGSPDRREGTPGRIPPTLPFSGMKKAPPPPINRANKPSTPTIGGWTSLEPTRNARAEERTSPFNTPPSSDESPSRSGRHGQSTKGAPKKWTLSANQSYFPPPRHPATDARRASTAPSQRFESPKGERRVLGSPEHAPDLPEQRPQLPARRNIEIPEADVVRNAGAPLISSDHGRKRIIGQPPPRPSDATKVNRAVIDFLPPPKRNPIQNGQSLVGAPPRIAQTTKVVAAHRAVSEPTVPISSTLSSSRASSQQGVESDTHEPETTALTSSIMAYPDTSSANRRPPKSKTGVQQVYTDHETKLFEMCGRYICCSGYFTKVWDLVTGRIVLDLSMGERDIKITALAFKPGATTEEEGQIIWLGNNYGEIQEVDIKGQSVVVSKPNAHNKREITKMYRYQNAIWSADEDGKFHIWPPDKHGVPSLQLVPLSYRVSRGHTFSIVVKNHLWYAAGKAINVYNPMGGDNHFNVTMQPLVQPGVGEVTCGAITSNQYDKVFFGHADGKVSIYSTSQFNCVGIVNVSSYKINGLAGAGNYLWAAFSTGMIYVYDPRTSPWKVKKEWQAHTQPTTNIVVDRSSVWKLGSLQVASSGMDNTIRIWDGWLEDDWLESDMQTHDVDYCDFRELRAVVATWNAGASTPGSLRSEEEDSNFFREVIQPGEPPDLLVFGFQELVDLEDKKLTAKSIFKSSKKKDPMESDHMSHQYRAWRDYLVRVIEDNMPANEPYHLVHTANMIGLFSCIFIKASHKNHIRDLSVAEVKRGLGGLHGNKGALIIRFMVDDSSLCFTNCHLAAGQSKTVDRNNDIAAILEASALPREADLARRIDHFIGGGDGSMILDHEICILNGDLNYRIDTMGRDTVVKAIKANNLSKLLERDQLLVSRRRNAGFRLRVFNEQQIGFAPTYKYDVGTDRYDTSEKNRSPAWCDRILYRGVGRMKQLEYRRHELRVSDHRPVSGAFKMRVKRILPNKRETAWRACEQRLLQVKQALARDARLDYLVSVLGTEQMEAIRLIDG